jgi:hypothetical protein
MPSELEDEDDRVEIVEPGPGENDREDETHPLLDEHDEVELPDEPGPPMAPDDDALLDTGDGALSAMPDWDATPNDVLDEDELAESDVLARLLPALDYDDQAVLGDDDLFDDPLDVVVLVREPLGLVDDELDPGEDRLSEVPRLDDD